MYQNVSGHTPDSALFILTDKFLPPPPQPCTLCTVVGSRQILHCDEYWDWDIEPPVCHLPRCDGSDRCSVIWTQALPVRLRVLDVNFERYICRRDSFFNESKKWKCPSPIDLAFCVLIVSHLITLGSVRLMMTCGDSLHCDIMWHATNMCQDVRPLEASHMWPGVAVTSLLSPPVKNT